MGYKLLHGNCMDVLKTIPDESVQCCVTSPPYYGLRDYGTAEWNGGDPNCDHSGKLMATRSNINSNTGNGETDKKNKEITEFFKETCKKCGAKRIDSQIGLEQTPEAYVDNLVSVFHEIRRVLKGDGTLWINLGDSYWGGKGSNANLDKNIDERILMNRTLQRPQTRIEGMKITPTNGKHPFIKPKDLIGIPWMVAFALRADGWYLRKDIIWNKPNPMPESVRDRPTTSHEYIFLLSKSKDYYYDYEAILEPANYDGRKDTVMKGSKKYQNGFAPTDDNPNTLAVKGHERWPLKIGRTSRKMEGTNYGGDGSGLHGHSGYYDKDGNPRYNQFEDGTPARNKRDVWTVTTKPYKDAHFATYPPDLIEPCILAGSRAGDTVLDPFNGSGTTGAVSIKHHRNYIGIDLNAEYLKLSKKRILEVQPVLFDMKGAS